MSEYTIGIDIGGTNMRGILFNGDKVVESFTLSTPEKGLDKFYSFLKALVGPLAEKAKYDKKKINGIGLSIAGMHDLKEGKVVYSPNITYLNGADICSYVEKKLNLTAKLDNDANCFLRAEVKFGVGAKFKNVFGITLGTGIGGAWWLNNKIYRGSHGGAGEVGHTLLYFSQKQELEEIYHWVTNNDPSELAERAYRGEETAEKAFKEMGGYLGTACANIVNLVDPEAIIMGGGVLESSDLFLPAVKETMKENIANPLSKHVKILKAKTGNDAGAIGAALLFS